MAKKKRKGPKGLDEVNPAVAAAALGRLGGLRTAAGLSKAKRRIRAHKAAVARWSKVVAKRASMSACCRPSSMARTF